MSRRKGMALPPDVEAKARALLAAGDYDRTREAEDETSRLLDEARRSVGAKRTDVQSDSTSVCAHHPGCKQDCPHNCDCCTRQMVPPSKPAKVSRTERDYGMRLQSQRMAGLIRSVEHNPDPIELPAHRAKYYADYRVVLEDGTERYIEVKGAKGRRPHWWDSESKLKVKLAARILSQRVPPAQMCVAWPKKGGGWNEETVPA